MTSPNGDHKAKLARLPALDQKPQRGSLFIATPAYGGQFCGNYVDSLLHLVRSLVVSQIPHVWYPLLNESLITRARNRCVAAFLESKCSHLLFIDADVGFTPRDVHMLTVCELEVVCGMYPMKNYAWHTIAERARAGVDPKKLPLYGALYAMNPTVESARTGDVHVMVKEGHRYIESMDAATGFLLISREAMQKYIDAYGEEIAYCADYTESRGQIHWDVFGVGKDPAPPEGSGPPRYLSEDYYFSRRWQQLGGKIYCCLDIKLSHMGMHIWTGDPDLLLQPEPVSDAAQVHAEPVVNADDVVMVDP